LTSAPALLRELIAAQLPGKSPALQEAALERILHYAKDAELDTGALILVLEAGATVDELLRHIFAVIQERIASDLRSGV
jgi:hypothetical protein